MNLGGSGGGTKGVDGTKKNSQDAKGGKKKVFGTKKKIKGGTGKKNTIRPDLSD